MADNLPMTASNDLLQWSIPYFIFFKCVAMGVIENKYDSVHITTVTMVKFRSDLHSRPTPHSSPVRRAMGCLRWLYKENWPRYIESALYWFSWSLGSSQCWLIGPLIINFREIRIQNIFPYENKSLPILSDKNGGHFPAASIWSIQNH